jgi:integrase
MNLSRQSGQLAASRSYLRIQASVLGIFSKAFPDRLAHEIGSSEIDEWLKARGKSLHTRLNYQSYLHNLFNFAIRRQYVGSNPIDRLEKVTPDEKPVEILTVEEAARLLEAGEASGSMTTPFRLICGPENARNSSSGLEGRRPRREDNHGSIDHDQDPRTTHR